MSKFIHFLMISSLTIFSSQIIQAAEERMEDRGQSSRFSTMQRPSARLYQIEGGDYLFTVPSKTRLFKGPIDDLKEIFVCNTYFTSTGDLGMLTHQGTLMIDKQKWKDNYENVFNLNHIKKENNPALFSKIILKNQGVQKTQSEKLEKAGLASTTDLAPRSRLYRIEDQEKYFFVGYRKDIYYEDETRNYKSTTHSNECYIPCEGHTARIFFGEYPQLKEVLSSESFYPGQSSSLGPYQLIGCGSNLNPICNISSLNLLKSQWTDKNSVIHKLIHIRKLGNEEFYNQIQLIEDKSLRDDKDTA